MYLGSHKPAKNLLMPTFSFKLLTIASFSLDVFFSLDNHDILSMKLYDLDNENIDGPSQEETAKIVPRALKAAAYRGECWLYLFAFWRDRF